MSRDALPSPAPDAPPSGVHARLLRLAAPIIVSNITVPLLGAVDTAVVGHLPDPAYLGGVAVGVTIFDFLYWGFGFLRMGTTGFVAQARGARDAAEVRAVLGRALLIAAALGLTLIVLQVPIMTAALGLVGASPDVEQSAAAYVAVRIWSAPATLANYALLGWLFGMQRPKTALVLQVFTNSLNIGLDLWFVVGLGWDVPGVAAASVIADYAGSALGLLVILRTLPGHAGWERRRLFERDRLLAMLRVNRDIFIRTLCLIFAFAWFTVQGARLGDVTLAANAVLLNLQSIMAYGLDGLAFAAEAMIGAAVGARDRVAFLAVTRAAALWSGVVAAGVAVGYAIFGSSLVALFTNLPEVRAAAAIYLPWMVVSPLISVWSYVLDGIYVGATRAVEMRNGMLIALIAYLAAAAVLVPAWGNNGLWLALMILMVARAVTLGAWYPRLLRSVGGAA
jgi:MATE family multidrug resistance protein